MVEVDVERVAHGGWCVGRHEGRVVLIRHTLPGERVQAVVTEGRERDRFWRADATEILRASADRVRPPCPYAGPGACGGCDWQHVRLPAQRQLKAAVVQEQLRRLAGLERVVEVEAMPAVTDAPGDGLGWRTRTRFAVDEGGQPGLRRHRSHDVLAIDDCLITHPDAAAPELLARSWPGASTVGVAVSGTGQRAVWTEDAEGRVSGVEGPRRLREQAAGRTWRVAADGFWQVHPSAAATLVDAVIAGAGVKPGDHVLDLYSGVGLFAAPLGQRVGETGSVIAIESDGPAIGNARRNVHDLTQVTLVEDRVDRALRHELPAEVDVVVLDPPRTGARAAVVAEIARRGPRTVVYVACDPAALARDVASFVEHGYQLASLRAFDLFPMTHHVECVAVLTPQP